MEGAAMMGNLGQVRKALHGITGKGVPSTEPRAEHYLVIVRSGHELDAVDSFRRHGVEAYYPTYEQLVVTRQRRGVHPVRRLRRVGLIPGYVFCRVDAQRDFCGLLSVIIGAIDVVRTASGVALLIGDADLSIIRKIAIDRGVAACGKQGARYKLGQRVRMIDDVLRRWPAGKVAGIARDGRISVDVELMGRRVTISVQPSQIEPA